MTVVVELDAASAEALQGAAGSGCVVVPSLDALRRHLEQRPKEYAAVLGPSVDLSAAVALADTLRVTRPTLGVILVRRRVDTAVLAEALRAGIRDVVEERDLTGLSEAVVHSYAVHAAMLAAIDKPEGSDEEKGSLITVFSAKGGVGKTTIATNLAASLAEGGKRNVCIVDLDLAFGDVSIVLQLFPVHTIADAISMRDKLDPAAVESLLTEHSAGLKALVAPVQPDAKDLIDGELVGKVLGLLRESFDYVVVDTPPAFDEVVLQAFDESDLLVLVGTLDVTALKSLKITIETLGLLNHPKDQWKLVINRADMKVGLSPSDFEATLKLPIAAAIPQSKDVTASINHGKLIVLESPRHPVSSAIRRLARDFTTDQAAEATANPAEKPAPEQHKAPVAPKRGGLRRRKVTS